MQDISLFVIALCTINIIKILQLLLILYFFFLKFILVSELPPFDPNGHHQKYILEYFLCKPYKYFHYSNPSNTVQENPQNQLIGAQALPLVQTSFPYPNQPLTIKLDRDNYLIWKNQLLNVVIANELEGFLDITHPCPHYQSRILLWQRYNRLIMSWFYAFLSKNVMTQIVGYNTASEIWLALGQIYALTLMARLVELHTQLQSLKKGSMFTLDYIQNIKGLYNSLVAIKEPISRNNQLIYMFNGLDPDCNVFVTFVNNRSDLPSLEEIHSLFLSYEFRLE